MKNSNMVTRGTASSKWTNNSPPTKGNLDTTLVVKKELSIKAWKLILTILVIISLSIFIFTR